MTLNPPEQISTVTFNNSQNSLAVHLEDLHEGVDRQNTSRYIGVYYALEDRSSEEKHYQYFGTKPCVDMMGLSNH